jgi:arylsulfatase A-like enzyme
MSRPNILLIQADQHRADCLGVNGHPLVQTPHLDGLARAGANFRHAFCPIPLCTPSRTSLLTGLWPTQHGSITNPDTEAGRALAAGLPTFSQALHQAGYFLGCVGKWGVDAQHGPTHYGFDIYLPEKQYATWRKEQGLPPRPRTNRWFGEVDPYIHSEQSQLAWGAQRTIELLQRAANSDRPFFLRWDPSEPHLPNIVPEPFASLYPPSSIPPWRNFPDPMLDKPYIQRQQQVTWGIDGWSWADWAPIVGRYLGEISLLDQQVGRVLAELEALNLAENTLVIYTADHGDLCGGHGLIDKHFVFYDELVRVPLILRWPAQIAAGQQVEAFVCHAIDLATTFCAAAGVERPVAFAGQSLLPLAGVSSAVDADQPPRTDIFASYHGNQFGLYSQRMVRDHEWKYVWNATSQDELYRLTTDPGELVNLVGQPTFTAELARLRQRLVAWMETTRDPLLNGWTREQLLDGRKL